MGSVAAGHASEVDKKVWEILATGETFANACADANTYYMNNFSWQLQYPLTPEEEIPEIICKEATSVPRFVDGTKADSIRGLFAVWHYPYISPTVP